jgi:release factor glutamine methyltransferase
MQTRQLERSRVRSILAWGEGVLRAGPHPERARLDAEVLLLHVFKQIDQDRNSAWLIAHQNDPTSSDTRIHFEVMMKRRLTGEPIQYITGQTEFYGLPFRVTPAVLIPRPETEHLVEEVLNRAKQLRVPQVPSGTWEPDKLSSPGTRPPTIRILDIGTGSGCIVIALAHYLPNAAITAIDCSSAALDLARQNAALNQLENRIRFLHGDLLAPVSGETFDMIVSNPPYVPTADRPSLSVEVRDHEPALALFAGDDGLDIYRHLIPAACAALTPGGLLALEIGYGQQPALFALLESAAFHSIEIIPDLQGIPRVLCALRRHPVPQAS